MGLLARYTITVFYVNLIILSRAIFFLFQKVMGLTVGWEFIYKLAEGFGIAREIKIFIFLFRFFKNTKFRFFSQCYPQG